MTICHFDLTVLTPFFQKEDSCKVKITPRAANQGSAVKGTQMADDARWYDKDTLQVVNEIMKKDESGMTNRIMMTRVREMGLLASVTTIEKHIYGIGAGLIDYKNTAVAHEVAANPPTVEDYNEDGTLKREYLKRAFANADENCSAARDKGKEIHAWAARFIEKAIMPSEPIGIHICNEVGRMLKFVDAKDISCEKALGGKAFGFCGTPDRDIGSCNLAKMQEFCGEEVTFPADMLGEVILDTKTQEWKKKPAVRVGMKRQLGGYGLLTDIGVNALYVQEFIHRETGEVIWKTYNDVEFWKGVFADTFKQWCKIKDYWPKENPEDCLDTPACSK